MLKITKITAAQAKSYYAKDDHYYVQPETLSEWSGELAADLNLTGQVRTDDFEAMLEGNLPNGEKLPGKGNDPANRRAGFDATFSAPKSFSIAALLQDDRLLYVHQQAVKIALQVAETRYAQDREWNQKTKAIEVKQTGKFAIAIFDHDTSRDLDPNLHTHAVILNGTQNHNGNYRSLYTDELYANRKLLDDIYLNELAYGARELGYEIESTQDGFELAGYHKELRDTFSQRRKAIEQYVAKELEPGAVPAGRQYGQAALKTRTRKREVDRESLLEDWAEILAAKQLTLPIAPQPTEERDLMISGQIQAIVAARDGIAHAEERESVFRRGKVERFALEHHCGLQSWQQLQAEIAKTEQLIQVDATRDRYTTQTAIDRERETIAFMRQGQERVQPIADQNRVSEIAPDTLTAGQRAALELSVTTTDRTIAWQGGAGTGKSYALDLYRQLATAAGYAVRGFAPSAAAAMVLSEEAGIGSNTVASLLNSKSEWGQSRQNSEIWIIDEAGLLSAKDAHALLKHATAQNARVLLVGDMKQLSAVEAGNPFRSLQQHGMTTAYLGEFRRQKTEHLKAAVNAIANEDLKSGFYHLDQGKSIRAVETPAARVSCIVEDYLDLSPYQRSRTLIVANTNAERRSITQNIRVGLQAEGELAADTFMMTSLKPHDWTTAEAKYAKQYELGDVIVPTQDYRKQQLVKGQQCTVVGIDETKNQLKLEAIDGQRWEIDPSKCDRKTVYKTELIPLAPGDKLRWTRNDRDASRRNGQEFTIEGLDQQGRAIVRDKDDKTAFIDLSGRQFADYALVSTVYAAQGKTADRVLAALDGTTAKESFYVAASRAKHELALYTTDAIELRKLAAQSRANENASDYINLFTYENHHAQNQTRTAQTTTRRSETAPTDDRADRGVSIGSCVASRLAANLQRDCRVESGTSDLDQSLDELNQSVEVSGINAGTISRSLAAFIEQRTFVRNGAAITDALESIATNLNQLERVSQQLEHLCHKFTEYHRESSREAVVEAGSGVAANNDVEVDAIITATTAINSEDLFASIRAEYGISIADGSAVEDDFSDNSPLTEDGLPSVTQEQTHPTSTWAAEIATIAARLFEYYVEQGDIEIEDAATEGEVICEIKAGNRVYLLVWDESTGECNVRGKGRDLDIRSNHGITEQDIEIWRDWGNWLEQQSVPDKRNEDVSTAAIVQSAPVEALPEVPLTLETAIELTAQDWLDLIPRQQLKLAIAARQHRATEPGGYTQAEQWVGQRSGLQRQLNEAKVREQVARETLQDLKDRGERSFFNPFGATKTERYDASIDLSTAKEARKQLEAEIKRIDDRQAERDRQDAARWAWQKTSETQGTQHILALVGQPELKAQFRAVEQLYQQLQQWCDLAQSAQPKTKLRAEEIVTMVSAYLDGQGLPMQTRQQMQEDLAQAQRHSRNHERGLSR